MEENQTKNIHFIAANASDVTDVLEHQFYISQVKRNAYFAMKEAHVHPFYEIYYLLSGKRRIFVNHTIYVVNKGDIVAIH